MSAKKKPTILGPDGKPLPTTPPKPSPIREVTMTIDSSYIFKSYFGSEPLLRVTTAKPKPADMKSTVDAQLAELHDALPADWAASPETPPPTAEELDRYDVAQAWAMRKCEHKRTVNTMYMREWQCRDCGRYFEDDPNPRMFGFWS